jgi:hypothetical protein
MARARRRADPNSGVVLGNPKGKNEKGIDRTEALSHGPNLSPLPWFSGYRQLVSKDWARGRDNRLRGHVQSGRLPCHRRKLRHTEGDIRRSQSIGVFGRGNGTVPRTGTSVPFGEKENPAASAPLAFALPVHAAW